jgi:DNA-binding MarR family transcriptional regulator
MRALNNRANPSGLTMDCAGRTTACMRDAAEQVCELFPAIYLRFCKRRKAADIHVTPQMDAVLLHLATSGPLTIGEMATHFGRAQSVVSGIVTGLEKKGLLERMRDERDRRRTLVWLTGEARAVLSRRQQVLDVGRVERALRRMREDERRGLVEGMRALVRTVTVDTRSLERGTKQRRTVR